MNDVLDYIEKECSSIRKENSYLFAIKLADKFGFDIYYDCVKGYFVAGRINKDSLELFDSLGRYYPQDGSILTLKQYEENKNN